MTGRHRGILRDARARAAQDMPDVDVSLGLSEETFEPTLKKYPVGGRPAPCKPRPPGRHGGAAATPDASALAARGS